MKIKKLKYKSKDYIVEIQKQNLQSKINCTNKFIIVNEGGEINK